MVVSEDRQGITDRKMGVCSWQCCSSLDWLFEKSPEPHPGGELTPQRADCQGKLCQHSISIHVCRLLYPWQHCVPRHVLCEVRCLGKIWWEKSVLANCWSDLWVWWEYDPVTFFTTSTQPLMLVKVETDNVILWGRTFLCVPLGCQQRPSNLTGHNFVFSFDCLVASINVTLLEGMMVWFRRILVMHTSYYHSLSLSCRLLSPQRHRWLLWNHCMFPGGSFPMDPALNQEKARRKTMRTRVIWKSLLGKRNLSSSRCVAGWCLEGTQAKSVRSLV